MSKQTAVERVRIIALPTRIRYNTWAKSPRPVTRLASEFTGSVIRMAEDMRTWIVLLRGINVGARHRLPMPELVRHLESLGLEGIRTYGQSGNVVFRSRGSIPETLGERVASLVEGSHGFRPEVLLLNAQALRQAMEANPFPDAEDDPRTLHLFFLASPPKDVDVEALHGMKAPSERFHLTNRVLYLRAPEGIGRSRLAANVERLLGVSATARNWRTVCKLWKMAAETHGSAAQGPLGGPQN